MNDLCTSFAQFNKTSLRIVFKIKYKRQDKHTTISGIHGMSIKFTATNGYSHHTVNKYFLSKDPPILRRFHCLNWSHRRHLQNPDDGDQGVRRQTFSSRNLCEARTRVITRTFTRSIPFIVLCVSVCFV